MWKHLISEDMVTADAIVRFPTKGYSKRGLSSGRRYQTITVGQYAVTITYADGHYNASWTELKAV